MHVRLVKMESQLRRRRGRKRNKQRRGRRPARLKNPKIIEQLSRKLKTSRIISVSCFANSSVSSRRSVFLTSMRSWKRNVSVSCKLAEMPIKSTLKYRPTITNLVNLHLSNLSFLREIIAILCDVLCRVDWLATPHRKSSHLQKLICHPLLLTQLLMRLINVLTLL